MSRCAAARLLMSTRRVSCVERREKDGRPEGLHYFSAASLQRGVATGAAVLNPAPPSPSQSLSTPCPRATSPCVGVT